MTDFLDRRLFERHPEVMMRYEARELIEVEAQFIMWETIRYLPQYTVLNTWKPEKRCVAFHCTLRLRSTSLIKGLLREPDWSKRLIEILLGFLVGKFALSAKTGETVSQVKVPDEDADALLFCSGLYWGPGCRSVHSVQHRYHLCQLCI